MGQKAPKITQVAPKVGVFSPFFGKSDPFLPAAAGEKITLRLFPFPRPKKDWN